MGKRRLLTSIALGAAVGGIISLFDRDTRHYTKDKLQVMKEKTSYCLNHPSETVHNFKLAVDQFNRTFSYQVENASNALEQVENTLDKVTNKTDRMEG